MIKLTVFMAMVAMLLAQETRPRRVVRPDGSVTTGQPGFSLPYPSQQPPSQPEYTGPRGSLSGTVLDSASGAPIKKAQVRISYGQQTVAVTDASGSFSFEQLPPGTYVVYVNHPEYPANGMSMQQPEQFTVAPGEQKRGVTVKLTPGIAASGKITDDDGDPLANCNVNLLTRTASEGLQPMHSANTNGTGDYLIPNTPGGKYYLQARCTAPYLQPRAFGPPNAVPAGTQLGYAPRFYPGTASFNGAQKIKLIPGQPARGLDFRMSLQTVTTVSVHVTGLDEERRGRLFASLTPNDNPLARNSNSRAGMVEPRTGMAQIRNVPAGEYTLLLTSNGPERMVVGRQTVQVTEEPCEITVQVVPTLPLAGIIQMEVPAPSQNPAANFAPKGNGMISLTQVDEQSMLVSAPVAEDGSFTLKAVTPGRYRISAMGGFVQSISIGGETSDGPEFLLKEGAAGPLMVKLGFIIGTLSGEVQLGDSHASEVLVFALAGMGLHSMIVHAGTPGQPLKYSLPLPPGKYRVYAVEVTDKKVADRLMASDAIVGREETVEIRASAETTRNLKMVTAAEIEKADQ